MLNLAVRKIAGRV